MNHITSHRIVNTVFNKMVVVVGVCVRGGQVDLDQTAPVFHMLFSFLESKMAATKKYRSPVSRSYFI